jgi:hypothetical protein
MVGLAAALAMGVAMEAPAGVRYLPEARHFRMPGSWIPLGLILAIFVARYLLAIVMAIDPSLHQATGFALGTSIAYGLLGGIFPARAVRVWSKRFAY